MLAVIFEASVAGIGSFHVELKVTVRAWLLTAQGFCAGQCHPSLNGRDNPSDQLAPCGGWEWAPAAQLVFFPDMMK